MSLWDRIKKFFGRGPTSWTDPDSVHVDGGLPQYADTVKATFWAAAAALEKAGYCKQHKHKIKTFEFRVGTHTEPGKGWGVWDNANGIYVAGSCGGSRIMIVVAPTTLALNPGRGVRDMRHEWGHGLLYGDGVPDYKHHEIMARVGL